MPPAPFALHGAVITPDAAWSSGYVTVAEGLIDAGLADEGPPRSRSTRPTA